MMRLKLTVDVPTSADQDEVLKQLALCGARGEGVTVTTPTGLVFDVDLLDVERLVFSEALS